VRRPCELSGNVHKASLARNVSGRTLNPGVRDLWFS
jgi:hypothetical protein